MIPSADERMKLLANLHVPEYNKVVRYGRARQHGTSRVAVKAVLTVLAGNEGLYISQRAISDRLGITPLSVSCAMCAVAHFDLATGEYDRRRNVYRYTINWEQVEAMQDRSELWLPRARRTLSASPKAVYCRAWRRAQVARLESTTHADQFSKSLGKPSGRTTEEIDVIFAEVCRQFGVSRSDVTGQSRRADIVHARMFIVGIARDVTDAKYEDLMRAMGKTTHSTTVSMHRRLQCVLAADPDGSIAANYRTVFTASEACVQRFRAAITGASKGAA